MGYKADPARVEFDVLGDKYNRGGQGQMDNCGADIVRHIKMFLANEVRGNYHR